jgi:hypothetical protein
MPKRKTDRRRSRREFVACVGTLAASGLISAQTRGNVVSSTSGGRAAVYIIPHFHPASCG